MLLNGTSEELAKYSTLDYDSNKFIKKVKEVWEFSSLQIRCIYLISDLAKKGNGVFSIAHSTFKHMFKRRFKKDISLSSVKRIYKLLEKLGLISINVGKRKNQTQSANIIRIEQQYEESTEPTQNDSPLETPFESRNIVSKETNNGEQQPLKNDFVNYQKKGINTYLNPNDFKYELEKACNDLYATYSIGRWNKRQWLKLVSAFVKETVSRGMNRKIPNKNVAPYAYASLKNIAHKHDLRNGKVKKNFEGLYYDWLNGD
ncbi:hypothetical protein [Halobacillus kuroshimensis]|uniref:hypothetical protein n=1 Tax=Halobacillus kuroshimensis TaxID=302481 RepID=UPI00040B9763|nr:hypothetical protein [Halobacillus kuroshimensis]